MVGWDGMGWMDGMGWLSLEGAIYRAPTVLIISISKIEEERVLNFKEGDSLELFCHGGSDA